MRKFLVLLTSLMLSGVLAFAQTHTVSGTVIDESGTHVPYATVVEKGTRNATTADANGNFSIKMKGNGGLSFTATGFNGTTVNPTGNSVTATLVKNNTELATVSITTAFGVKREKKALGYSSQEITAKDLNQANQGNAFSALSGKVAGLQITNSTGDPGAAAYIRLRGITSLGGGQPLIVVDGVPIDNSTTGTSLGNVSQSNRGVDLNPDDIESVSVLKGPAAASLYGTQGSDGVILITTKRGKKSREGKMFDISYDYGITIDHVNKLPDLQMKYAKGSAGKLSSFTSGTSTSFGPLNDTLAWTGVANVWDPHGDIVGASNPAGRVKFVPYNNPNQFFRNGKNQSHNIALSGGNDNLTYRFSYSNLYQEGIIPTSNFERNTVRLNADAKLTDKLSTGASMSYIVSGGERVQEGSNTSGILLGLLRTPNSFDNSNGATSATDPIAYLLPSGFQRTYRGIGDGVRGYYDNPYWTINKNKFRDRVNRIIGNVYLTYTFTPWLSVTDRVGLDQYTDSRKQNFAIASATAKPGSVIYNDYVYQSVNNNLIATLTHKIVNNINGSLLLGSIYYSERYHHENATGSTLIIPDFYDLSNSSNQTASSTSYNFRTKAFFAQAKFDFKSYLFVDGTIRSENSSAFVSDDKPKGRWIYFPSINGSFVFSDALKINSGILSFGKLRASYGVAGRLPSIFSTTTYFSSQTIGDGWTNGLVYPINGQQGFFAGTLGNPKLRPERTSSLDLGTELRFFKGRFGIDFTYYDSKSKDLLLSVPLAPSSGYGSQYTNAASIKNHGIEVILNATPVRTKSFSWDMTINWSMNKSLVTSLGPGVQTLFLGGFTNGAINAVAGQPFGVIYGIGYVKDSKGNTVINDDPTNAFYGYPIVDSKSRALGDPNPKWQGGIQNKFTFKNFTLSVLFDTRQKFDMWDGTRGALFNFGTAKETETRGQEHVFEGVLGHLDATGTLIPGSGKNTNVVKPGQSWYQGGGSGFIVNEPFIEDASFVKLRELAIGYTLNLEKSKISKVIRSLDFNLIGRNLFLWTKYKGVDPETSLAGGTALGIDYFNNPGTRSLGFNVKVNF
jgi:TonB-linked SusC/RagA family outer membrane protein